MPAITHWLYPINSKGGYVLRNPSTGETTEVSPQELLRQIELYPDKVDPWYLISGFRLMKPGDAVWIYASGDMQAIVALGRAIEIYEDEEGWHVNLAWDLGATRALMNSPIPRADYGQVVQTVARAQPPTEAVLERWLRWHDLGITNVNDTMEPRSLWDARARVLAEIVRRRGQRPFRATLIHQYESRCAITGDGAVEALEAAHIDPYMGNHSNKPSNGLLLRADVHTLFDLHLIGVDPNRRICVSTSLRRTSYEAFNGGPLRLPGSKAALPNASALARHFALVKGKGVI